MDSKNIDILTEPRIISRSEYKHYCKRYKIKLMKKIYHDDLPLYIHKTLYELANEIYKFELEHNTLDGLYF
jgi:hypothetical protein